MLKNKYSRRNETMKYSFTSRIRYSEIGEDGNLTLPGLINYFQDLSMSWATWIRTRN